MPDPSGPVPSASEESAHPHIRSFSLRHGRFTQAQRRAFDRLLPVFGIAYVATPLDFARAFGRAAPTVIEIGCGMGETTVAIAQSRPDVNFLAVEVFAAGVGALLKQIEERQLSNIRVVHHDAVEVVRDMIAADTLAGIHIYFPDPWPKKRHHKRRLLQRPFADLLVSKLEANGYLHFATDWPDYAQQVAQLLEASPQLAKLHTGEVPTRANPLCTRPVTKFHARGDRLGHVTCDLVFVRKAKASVTQLESSEVARS